MKYAMGAAVMLVIVSLVALGIVNLNALLAILAGTIPSASFIGLMIWKQPESVPVATEGS